MRDSRSPTSTITLFPFFWAQITTDCHQLDGVHRSLVAALHGLLFYVQENNENLQITNFAGLWHVIWAGKTLEHRELQLICVTWQQLSGSVKYLSVYFSKCGNIFIAWSGSSERMQIAKHTHMHTLTHTQPPVPIFPVRDSFALGENDFMHHLYPLHICIPSNPLLILRYL